MSTQSPAHPVPTRAGSQRAGNRSLSIVIPVYNSEYILKDLIARLMPVLHEWGAPFEVVMVNDGSKDGSWSVLCELQRSHPDHLTAINLMRNFGQHNAIMCGLRQCSGEFVVTMDDDLQNPPEEIPKLLRTLEADQADLVYGCYESKKHEKWRNLGSEIAQIFYRRIFRRSNRVTAFRAIRRDLVDSILTYSLNFTYLDGLFAWNTDRISEVLVDHHGRRTGRSGYSVRRLVLLAFNLFTNFSLMPLQIVSLFGFLLAISGFAVGAYYVLQHFLNNIVVPGFAATIVAVLMLGGAQLIALGVMGEYLGRLHLNVNRKPQYVCREIRVADVTADGAEPTSESGDASLSSMPAAARAADLE